MQDAGCWILDAGSWILDAGRWIQDTGYWMLDTGSGKSGKWEEEDSILNVQFAGDKAANIECRTPNVEC
jgi:hypothetical protein